MFSKIQDLGGNPKEPSFEKWANTIRLMREGDKRTDEEIRAVFTWANQDGFWKSNILSPDKLREKWQTLNLKMKGSRNGHDGKPKHDPVAAGRCT
jgi:N-acetylneuraminic acid mutarotase